MKITKLFHGYSISVACLTLDWVLLLGLFSNSIRRGWKSAGESCFTGDTSFQRHSRVGRERHCYLTPAERVENLRSPHLERVWTRTRLGGWWQVSTGHGKIKGKGGAQIRYLHYQPSVPTPLASIHGQTLPGLTESLRKNPKVSSRSKGTVFQSQENKAVNGPWCQAVGWGLAKEPEGLHITYVYILC